MHGCWKYHYTRTVIYQGCLYKRASVLRHLAVCDSVRLLLKPQWDLVSTLCAFSTEIIVNMLGGGGGGGNSQGSHSESWITQCCTGRICLSRVSGCLSLVIECTIHTKRHNYGMLENIILASFCMQQFHVFILQYLL